jgi:hypothetical protein
MYAERQTWNTYRIISISAMQSTAKIITVQMYAEQCGQRYDLTATVCIRIRIYVQ